jgi:hypothetical protein
MPLTHTPPGSLAAATTRPPRTHAKGVHIPAAGQVRRQLIFRRAQRRVSRKVPILRPIDPRLQVLDAYPHRKRLLFHGQAGVVQHG